MSGKIKGHGSRQANKRGLHVSSGGTAKISERAGGGGKSLSRQRLPRVLCDGVRLSYPKIGFPRSVELRG